MPLLLFIVFIAVPLVELALLIKLGSIIGVLPTIAIVLLTALLGTILLRQQGLATLRLAQSKAQQGEPPIEEVLHGVMIAVGGIMLLTPGLVTDCMGLLLLLPPVRQFAGRKLWRFLAANGSVHVQTSGGYRPGGGPGNAGERGPRVIDSEDYVVVNDKDEPKGSGSSDSPWDKRS